MSGTSAPSPVLVDRAARDRLAVRFGADVAAWCDGLPSLVAELAGRWRLRPVESKGGSTSRVLRCLRRDTGATVWLKLTPDPVVAAEEAEALTLWSGTPSVVDLLEQDLRVGALLLADVSPRGHRGPALRSAARGPARWRRCSVTCARALRAARDGRGCGRSRSGSVCSPPWPSAG